MSVSEAAICNETALRELRNGNAAAAQQLLERAVAVEPRHLFALLQKATLLESQGKQRAAAKVYHNALQTISPGREHSSRFARADRQGGRSDEGARANGASSRPSRRS